MQLSTKLPWELAQTKWSSILNPLLAMPMLNGNQITGVKLLAGIPQPINHLLARKPQGWILTDNTANTAIWRTTDFSQYAITLSASVDTTISFWIF